MKRRDSIKSIVIGATGSAALLTACAMPEEKDIKEIKIATEAYLSTRTPAEREKLETLFNAEYLTDHEVKTLELLCDWILPADQYGPAATEVGVVDFIDFIVKDMPHYKLPMRGGLMWLDHHCRSTYDNNFRELGSSKQKELLDIISYPSAADKGFSQGYSFFKLVKNLTLSGYYTSREGVKSIGFKGNTPNIWDGVPDEILKEHGLEYDPVWIAKCVDQSKREDVAEWDDEGNLLT